MADARHHGDLSHAGRLSLLFALLRRAKRSFRGSIATRFGTVIAMALLTGATAGVLPAVIGRAMGVVAGSEPPGAPPGAFARLVAAVMPAEHAWAVVVITLVATVATVGTGVMASRLGTALAGDVTAAMRIEMMRSVLAASARDVEDVGAEIAAPQKPPGLAAPSVEPGRAPPGKTPAKPGQAPPPGKAGPTPKPGAGDAGATRTAVVKLAVSREAALVSDFAVSVITGLPQTLATLAVLGVELVSSGAWLVLVGGVGLFVTSRLLADRASRRVGAARRELSTADAAVFGSLQETLSSSEDLRLWGAREQAVREFASVAQGSAEARERFAAALAVSGQIKSVFTAMAPLLLVIALELSGRSYGPGEVAKLLLLVPLLMIRLEALDAIRQGLLEREPVLVASDRLLGLPPAPPRAPDAVRLDLESVRGHIRFEGVRYTPPGAKRPVLDGVDLDVPPGSIVGICGPSGSGKSSLLRLLLRLDDPQAGRITIDGTDLAVIEPEQLPALFGVVRQTSQLLERSLRDNLALGLTPSPDDEAMRRALAAVHLEALAQGAERGLDTAYRKNPPSLSGGEHRRMLVARMLLQNAPIGILDEPEAGLPSGTAEQILASIREQAGGRTHLVVTHAPQLLDSDFNVVVEAGRIVGRGRHDELRRASPAYRALLAEATEA
jgi:ABC-type multidrug transport system fused ATPase/permease subunit